MSTADKRQTPAGGRRAPRAATGEPVPGSGAPDGQKAAERPTRLAVAAGLVALEGLAVLGVGIAMLVLPLTGDRTDGLLQAVTGAVTVLALAVLPLATARGLWLLRRWSRGPAVFTQLIALPVGWQMASASGLWVPAGLAVAATAAAGLVCLFHPRAAAALGVGAVRGG
ncbi:hypothetical protein [Streptomyces sp. GSL17-111]|uniref:hypothetical protein n=1 Tax=Streptomyces sp. GSL17-111 TaxID=3121596 RepID=UPI0030F3E0F7